MTPPQAAGNQIRPALRGIEYFEKMRDGIPLLKMARDCEVQGHQEFYKNWSHGNKDLEKHKRQDF